MPRIIVRCAAAVLAAAGLAWLAMAAGAAEPIRIGFSMSLTGGFAVSGKQAAASKTGMLIDPYTKALK